MVGFAVLAQNVSNHPFNYQDQGKREGIVYLEKSETQVKGCKEERERGQTDKHS